MTTGKLADALCADQRSKAVRVIQLLNYVQTLMSTHTHLSIYIYVYICICIHT